MIAISTDQSYTLTLVTLENLLKKPEQCMGQQSPFANCQDIVRDNCRKTTPLLTKGLCLVDTKTVFLPVIAVTKVNLNYSNFFKMKEFSSS